MKKLIENALKRLTTKDKKAEDTVAPHAQVTEEQVQVTGEQVEAYLAERYPEGAVHDFEYDEYEGKGDVITVMARCRNLNNHRNPLGFMEALTARNPGMFHDVTLDGWDLEQFDYWEETWVTFKGESGAGFHVSCYKIHRGFDIRMSTGEHGGAMFVTEQSLKELEAVIEAFMYVDSLTPEQPNSGN